MLNIYGDVLSQPVRAVWILASENSKKVEWKRHDLRISQGEHYKDEFKRKFPVGKVPAMTEVIDGHPDFHLFESHSIMKYICSSRQLPDHWYPTSDNRDIQLQAKIDVYLDWHHAGLRLGASTYFMRAFFSGVMGSKKWAT